MNYREPLIAERDSGRILRLTPGGEPEQAIQIPEVAAGGEGGLLGLAVSPNFDRDNLIYAYFAATGDNRIVRLRLDGGQPEVIYDGIAKAGFHNTTSPTSGTAWRTAKLDMSAENTGFAPGRPSIARIDLVRESSLTKDASENLTTRF